MTNASILKARVEKLLKENLIPFWTNPLLYPKEEGFLSRIDGNGRPDPKGDQSAVYYTRLLWTYSALARSQGSAPCENLADRAYDYLQRYFFDDENGGIYWLLDYQGIPIDSDKRSYAQAFYLYALSEYYLLKGDEWIADDAAQMMTSIETKTRDLEGSGYLEVFTADWTFKEDGRLSPKEPIAAKSMNTHLHVLEAYAQYLALDDSQENRDRLRALLVLFQDRIISGDSGHLLNTFDRSWAVVSKPISFGHDIEASWLLHEAAIKLEDQALIGSFEKIAIDLVDKTIRKGQDKDGGLFNELNESGKLDSDKHWWPQVEAVVALVNAWQLTEDEDYLKTAIRVWDYFENSIVDSISGSCFFRVSQDGVPYREENKLGPWKGPYHTVRACLEISKRLDTF